MDDLQSILDAVRERRGTWTELAKKANVSYSWLTKFAAGQIDNPGVVTLGKIAEAMSDDGHTPTEDKTTT